MDDFGIWFVGAFIHDIWVTVSEGKIKILYGDLETAENENQFTFDLFKGLVSNVVENFELFLNKLSTDLQVKITNIFKDLNEINDMEAFETLRIQLGKLSDEAMVRETDQGSVTVKADDTRPLSNAAAKRFELPQEMPGDLVEVKEGAGQFAEFNKFILFLSQLIPPLKEFGGVIQKSWKNMREAKSKDLTGPSWKNICAVADKIERLINPDHYQWRKRQRSLEVKFLRAIATKGDLDKFNLYGKVRALALMNEFKPQEITELIEEIQEIIALVEDLKRVTDFKRLRIKRVTVGNKAIEFIDLIKAVADNAMVESGEEKKRVTAEDDAKSAKFKAMPGTIDSPKNKDAIRGEFASFQGFLSDLVERVVQRLSDIESLWAKNQGAGEIDQDEFQEMLEAGQDIIMLADAGEHVGDYAETSLKMKLLRAVSTSDKLNNFNLVDKVKTLLRIVDSILEADPQKDMPKIIKLKGRIDSAIQQARNILDVLRRLEKVSSSDSLVIKRVKLKNNRIISFLDILASTQVKPAEASVTKPVKLPEAPVQKIEPPKIVEPVSTIKKKPPSQKPVEPKPQKVKKKKPVRPQVKKVEAKPAEKVVKPGAKAPSKVIPQEAPPLSEVDQLNEAFRAAIATLRNDKRHPRKCLQKSVREIFQAVQTLSKAALLDNRLESNVVFVGGVASNFNFYPRGLVSSISFTLKGTATGVGIRVEVDMRDRTNILFIVYNGQQIFYGDYKTGQWSQGINPDASMRISQDVIYDQQAVKSFLKQVNSNFFGNKAIRERLIFDDKNPTRRDYQSKEGIDFIFGEFKRSLPKAANKRWQLMAEMNICGVVHEKPSRDKRYSSAFRWSRKDYLFYLNTPWGVELYNQTGFVAAIEEENPEFTNTDDKYFNDFWERLRSDYADIDESKESRAPRSATDGKDNAMVVDDKGKSDLPRFADPKAKRGGIDLNPNNVNLEIKGEGMDVPMPAFDPVQLEQMNIEGFYPVIYNIIPVTNLPLLLGVSEKKDTQPSDSAQDKDKFPEISFQISPVVKEPEYALADAP